MFGSKIKIWMENYIVRPRKKEVQKEKTKETDNRGGIILESSESLNHSDTGISSSSQQVLSSSATENKEGYSTTTMESERSEATHCRTAISLPSPESAYSTGYSTDGTSPGAAGPPEYYINIRTGKHYFPSPAPTPTSPQPNTTVLQFHSANQCLTTPVLPEDAYLPFGLASLSQTVSSSNVKSNFQTSSRLSKSFLPSHGSLTSDIQGSPPRQSILSASVPGQSEIFSFSKSPCKKLNAKSQLASLKLFLKSPKQDKRKSKFEVNTAPAFENKKKSISNGKPKKWFKQPFQKFGNRRIDSCYERMAQDEARTEMHFEKNFSYFLAQENSTSPRQRNRIKTNPWLPTEPMSSQNFQNFQINFSPGLARNRSCSNTPLQNRKTSQVKSLQNRMKHLSLKQEEPKDYANSLEKAVNRYLSEELTVESSGHSDEDLTLNEMMGTYNESYIYEKETDILSDSDPTDCEDYITDSEANNGGDEQDSHDEEFDFIDNGSVAESDNFLINTGKCTYFDAHSRKNHFFHKSDHRSFRNISESRKNSKKSQDSKTRREKRKQARKSFKREDEEKQKTSEDKARLKMKIDENVGDLNFNRVLLERIKNISKSAEGTPTTARRRKISRELGGCHVEDQKVRRDVGKPFLILGDTEADKKYMELIKEAENIFEALRNSPVIKRRSEINCFDHKDLIIHRTDRNVETENVRQKEETMCCSRNESKKSEVLSRKSPKELGLKLSVEIPKKLHRLNFQMSKESSFKARSSAHSPLDPLGPTLRNFAVFKPVPSDERKISTSSSEDSESKSAFETKVPKSPVVPNVPIAFQSVDLGKPLTSYCPQSEPVKRKIYSCSKTFDKLVKQFETKPTIFEENINADVGRVSFATSARNPKA